MAEDVLEEHCDQEEAPVATSCQNEGDAGPVGHPYGPKRSSGAPNSGCRRPRPPPKSANSRRRPLLPAIRRVVSQPAPFSSVTFVYLQVVALKTAG